MARAVVATCRQPVERVIARIDDRTALALPTAGVELSPAVITRALASPLQTSLS